MEKRGTPSAHGGMKLSQLLELLAWRDGEVGRKAAYSYLLFFWGTRPAEKGRPMTS